MKSVIQKWLKFAEADLEAANLLFINGEKQGSAYQVCVYHCHQAIEKLLKAFLIKRGQPVFKIHDLVRLEEMARIILPSDLHNFIRDINPHYQAARYPDLPFVSSFAFSYKRQSTQKILDQTNQLFIWLKKELSRN